MTKSLVATVATLLVGGILGYLVFGAMRRPAPAPETPATPVKADLFTSDVVNKLRTREVNGQVPVTVDLGKDFGRDDPFAAF